MEEQLFMTTKPSDDNLNQYALLKEQVKQQKETNRLLSELVYLLNGFKNGGARLNGIVPGLDFLAYLHVIGPALARHLDDKIGAEEIKKGGVHLAQSCVEEFSAFSSCQDPKDKVISSLEFLNNPGSE